MDPLQTMVDLTVWSCHITYAFQSESTLYICLNVKELLAWNRHKIWSLSDWKETRIHNHLVRKWTLNNLAKLAKWLSCVAFDCMFLSCHVHVSEWIHTLSLSEYQGFGQMIELCCIWLHVLILSCTCFRVNLHSIFAWMSGNSLLEIGAKSQV